MSVVGARAAVMPRIPWWVVTAAVLALAAVSSVALLQRAPAAPAAAISAPTPSEVLQSLTRQAVGIEGGRMDLQAILATPEYFLMTGQAATGEHYGADRNVVLIYAEDIHFGDLPAKPRPALVVDGRTYEPSRAVTLADGDHHRATVLVYSDEARSLVSPQVGTLELRIAGVEEALAWERPFGSPGGATAPGLSIPLFLALMGGMLASMWPCLFQLTAYFLPSVAGISIQEASTGRRADRAVLRTAIRFVSGIVIVYTLAGFAAGVAAQSVAGTALLETARQPITLVAGLVIIGMAARMALRARQPMVCHMPTTSPSRKSGLGTVVLGLAFATGCMTCFGAAVVLGMFTYVVTTASPFVGAAILFVFSLGIAVPLVIAAMAMARVLPLITRLERAAPVLSLVSAAIMAGYGVLLISGTSHVISDGISRLMGGVL